MSLSNGSMIAIIIFAIITLIALIYYIWKQYSSSSSQMVDTSLDMPNMTIGGYRKWKRAMRKLRK
jgi:hypothetical protein